jgi:hypothetical protein
MTADFPKVWHRIEGHAGQTFHQKRGGEFSYIIRGNCVVPDRTDQQLPRSEFEKAYRLMPLESVVPLQSLRGPSYLFAILMDERIRNGDW